MDLFKVDIATIILLIIVSNFITLILVYLSMHQDEKNRFDGMFLIGKCLQILAWIGIGMRGVWPDLWTVSVANTFLSVGMLLEGISISSINGRVPTSYRVAGIVALTAMMLNLWIPGKPMYMIIGIGSFLFSFPLFISGRMLLRFQDRCSHLQISIGLLNLASYAVLCVRGAYYLMTARYSVMDPTLIQVISVFIFFGTATVGNVGYVLLKKEWLNHELQLRATNDFLTGILNRGAFTQQAERLLEWGKRKNSSFSMLLFDIDYFKRINDEYGHAVGDIVLIKVVDSVVESLRSYDLFGRFGGDEFIIFLPETGPAEAMAVAERIREKIEGLLLGSKSEVRCTISVGIASGCARSSGPDFDYVYGKCDEMLYQAKQEGRNRISATEIAD